MIAPVETRVTLIASHRFGIAAVLLELVPVVGILFAFTNTVGAALWAADLERKEETHKAVNSRETQ